MITKKIGKGVLKRWISFLLLFSLSLYQTPAFCSDQDNAPVSLYKIKGIWTDFWGNPYHTNRNFDRNEIANNGTGKVAVSLVWGERWDMDGSLPPAILLPGQEVYQGELFRIDPEADDEIKFYSERGIEVTAVLFGTPSRFRVSGCLPSNPTKAIFCESSTNGLNSFGRFAGMLARRYDGTRGNGRIKNFVIGNEVNRSEWYHIAGGYTGDRDTVTRRWVDSYAAFFKAAYDNIQSNQPTAKVFVPLDHAFSAWRWDRPTINDDPNPSLSTQTFLTEFAARMEGRTWRVAYHPYNTDLSLPTFNPNDAGLSGTITQGNIGLLPGWLRKTFPNSPAVYGDIILTESGFASKDPGSSELDQAVAISRSFRNVLGTPGITGYIYHRMMDMDPVIEPQRFSLRQMTSGEAKLSWYVWALMNRRPDAGAPPPHSGFELLPFTKLIRGYHPGENRRWASSRLLPPGFVEEMSWKLLRAPSPTRGMRMLYEFGPASGTHTFLSEDSGVLPIVDPACVGQEPRGPVGYVYTQCLTGLVPLYRFYNPATQNYLISQNSGGEGGYVASPQFPRRDLGYAYPSTATGPFLESDPSALFFIPNPVATLNPPPAPNAPSFLAAVLFDSQINLSWTDNSNNETGFKVYGSLDGVSFSQIGTTGADVALFSHTGLAANTLYYYKVRSFNAGGDSVDSSIISARPAPAPPLPPSQLTGVRLSSNGKINLSWVDNSNNETGFEVYEMSPMWGVSWRSIGKTGPNVTNLNNIYVGLITLYYYKVRAFNGLGDSVDSNTVSVRGEPLAAPSGLTATVVSNSQIDLSWVDNSNNENGFEVYRSLDGVSFSSIGLTGAGVTSFSRTGLAADTLYYYKVRAFSAVGSSDDSNTVNTRTATPAVPSGLTATVVSNSQINLSWVDNSNNETGFKVYGSPDGVNFSQIGTTGVGVTLFSHTGLAANTFYYYKIRSFNALGNSANSSIVSAKTAPLAAPSGLTAVGVSNSQINLSWVDNSNNETSFKIQRQGSVRTSPLYRLYNQGADSHFYTASLAERNMLIGWGWSDEGICGYVLPNPGPGLSALYRLYNPISGGHFYTASLAERNARIAAGLRDEGVAGYLYPNSVSGIIPLYRLYRNDPQPGRHLYTTSWEELVNVLRLPGWQYEGVVGYLATTSSIIEEENWTDLAVVPANGVFYEDRSVQAGLSYRYRIRATNSSGDSTDAVSGRVTATGSATQQPRSAN